MAKSRQKLYRQERALREQLRNLIEKRDKIDGSIDEIKKKLYDLPNTPVAYDPKPDNHVYCGKQCYISPHAARVAMRTINADLREKQVALLQRAYFCEKCEAWHLTSMA